MTLSQITAAVGFLAALFSLIAYASKALKASLTSFHDAHVVPAINGIAVKIDANTVETARLNERLVEVNENAKASQIESRQTFDRMGGIIADHETRLTVTETKVDALEGKRPTPRKPRRTK